MLKSHRSSVFVVALGCILGKPLGAQTVLASIGIEPDTAASTDSISARAGDRLRVAARTLRNPTLTGRLVAVRDDSLWLQHASSGAPLALARTDLTRVEVSRGYPGRRRRTIGGAVAGAAIGAVVGSSLGSGDRCDDCAPARISPRVGLGVFFSALSALGGMLAGSVIGHEEWSPGRLTLAAP